MQPFLANFHAHCPQSELYCMKLLFLALFISINCLAQEDQIVIATYSSDTITLNFLNSELQLKESKKIDLSRFEGWVSSSKYNSSNSLYPIQFSADGNRLFISLVYNDEMQGISYWTKFLSYDLETGKLEELIKIDDTCISFWHLINDKEIIGVSGQTLIKADLVQAQYDTVFDYNYYPQPLDLVTTESSVDFIIGAKKKLFAWRYNYESKKIKESLLASTTSLSSMNGIDLLTIEGSKMNTVKLRKSGPVPLVTAEKKIDVSNFNSFWDKAGFIYLMTKTQILKVDQNLRTVGKLKCRTPHIMGIIDDWIIYSTIKSGVSIDKAKHFATKTNLQVTVELPFLNNGQSPLLVAKKPSPVKTK